MNDDEQFAYIILANAFSNTTYIQREHWSTQRDFKLDPMLTEPGYLENERFTQVQPGNEGTKTTEIAAKLQTPL
jgi:hypothetical protein